MIEGDGFVIAEFGHHHRVQIEATEGPALCGKPGHRSWLVTVDHCGGLGDADLVRALECIADGAMEARKRVRQRIGQSN